MQRVVAEGEEPTWTVLGTDLLPVEPAETYLEALRQMRASPNTVKAYARALALWFEYLDGRGLAWDRFAVEHLAGFLGWMRSGLPPAVVSLVAPAPKVSVLS